MPSSCRSISRAVGQYRGRPSRGLPPIWWARSCLAAFGVPGGSYDAYALASTDFEGLARSYGRSAARPHGHADQGDPRRAGRQGAAARRCDSWQGSYTALQSKGADMVA